MDVTESREDRGTDTVPSSNTPSFGRGLGPLDILHTSENAWFTSSLKNGCLLGNTPVVSVLTWDPSIGKSGHNNCSCSVAFSTSTAPTKRSAEDSKRAYQAVVSHKYHKQFSKEATARWHLLPQIPVYINIR